MLFFGLIVNLMSKETVETENHVTARFTDACSSLWTGI